MKFLVNIYMEIGADVTVVSPNLMDQRSTRFHGIAATVAEKTKRKFENTEANLRKRGMHFFPLAVEMNGALGPRATKLPHFFCQNLQEMIFFWEDPAKIKNM